MTRRCHELGLPPAQTLSSYRIWDCYLTPAHSHPGANGTSRLLAEIERSLPAVRLGQFEKLCYFPHVGIGTTSDQQLEEELRRDPSLISRPLQRWPEMLLAMCQINPNDTARSADAIKRWVRASISRAVVRVHCRAAIGNLTSLCPR